MRTRVNVASLMVAVQLSMAGWAAAAAAQTPARFATAFEGLKALTGTWEGTGRHGEARVTYHLTGRGSALVETFYGKAYAGGVESSMSTVYHMDGPDLMLTHYCGARNQPRMKAVAYDPERKLVRFEFMDITNHVPGSYHTREVEVELRDEDHLRVGFGGTGAYELTRLE